MDSKYIFEFVVVVVSAGSVLAAGENEPDVSTGGIVGIVLGIVSLFVGGSAAIYCYCCKHGKHEDENEVKHGVHNHNNVNVQLPHIPTTSNVASDTNDILQVAKRDQNKYEIQTPDNQFQNGTVLNMDCKFVQFDNGDSGMVCRFNHCTKPIPDINF